MSSADGWRLHDAPDVIHAEKQVETCDEFADAGVEFVIPPVEIYRPAQGSLENVDWIVAELTSTVTLVERYRALIATRSFFTKKPSKAAFFPVNVASQHLLSVAYIATQSVADKLPFPKNREHIAERLSNLFVFSWKLLADKKKSRALIDLDFVLAKPPEGLPPTTDEEMFRRLKARDLEGAGYNMKTVLKLGDLDDKKKAKPVEQIVFDMLNIFYETRNVFTNNAPLDSITDQQTKKTCLIALRQAALYVRYFASAMLEATEPKQYARTFRLLDELTSVTHDLSFEINSLQTRATASVGSYPSGGGGGGSTGYTSGDVPFLPRRYDHVPESDEFTTELAPYANQPQGGPKPNF